MNQKYTNKFSYPRSADSKKWSSQGSAPYKKFTNLIVRYGIKGYKLGRNINGIDVDVFFPDEANPSRGTAVKLGKFSLKETCDLQEFGVFAFPISETLDETWLMAISYQSRLGTEIDKLKVKNYGQCQELENEIKKIIKKYKIDLYLSIHDEIDKQMFLSLTKDD